MQPDSHLSSMLIVEDSQGRRKIVLDRAIYSMGRDAKCDIRVASLFMSRHHATLIQVSKDDGSFYYRIVDGNLKGKPSSNGMLINGRKLRSHDLTNEDEIVFGPQARAIYYQLQRDISSDESDSNGTAGTRSPYDPYPVGPEFGSETLPGDGTSHIP